MDKDVYMHHGSQVKASLREESMIIKTLLLTTAKVWKQSLGPWTDGWIRWYVHTMKYYSAVK